jgi:hypothetical protein
LGLADGRGFSASGPGHAAGIQPRGAGLAQATGGQGRGEKGSAGSWVTLEGVRRRCFLALEWSGADCVGAVPCERTTSGEKATEKKEEQRR